jgi:hypothetical protein
MSFVVLAIAREVSGSWEARRVRSSASIRSHALAGMFGGSGFEAAA